MRVLMFGWEFPPFSSGGLGTHCYELTKALSGKGVNITFVMPNTGNEIKHNFIRILKASKKKIVQIAAKLAPYITSLETRALSEKGDSKAVYGMDFFQQVERYTKLAVEAVREEECDVIHCHDWMTFLAGIRASREKNKPLIVTLHSTEFDRTGGLSPNPSITYIEWLGLTQADKVITVSNYMKNQIIERYGIDGEKIKVIYNGINANNCSGEKINFGTNEKIVLFLGRLTVQKGPDYFIHAAKKVLEKEKNVRFIVVGDGYMLPQLINQSIELGIGNKIHFTGYVKSVDEFYRMADVYVMPSVSEPFGIVALEALAREIPVIISKQSGVSEVISHCLKVDFWDVNELANKIIGALKYAPLRTEMVKNGKKEIGFLSWERVAEETMDEYLKLINQ